MGAIEISYIIAERRKLKACLKREKEDNTRDAIKIPESGPDLRRIHQHDCESEVVYDEVKEITTAHKYGCEDNVAYNVIIKVK